MANANGVAENSTANLNRIDELVSGRRRSMLVLHNHPDPDALASAFALRYLLKNRYEIESDIAYDGIIGRAENLAMVRELNIPARRIQSLKRSRYDGLVLIDTQPGAANHPLQKGEKIDLVLDHHPRRRSSRGNAMIIETQVGATATLLVECLFAHDPAFAGPVDLASALAYAIRSETQDLGREASARDIRAYLAIYPHASMRKLSRIIYPKLSTDYFISLQTALARARIYRQLICAHIGPVHAPEIVAEVADLLLRRRKTTWSLVTGRYQNSLYLSLRSSNLGARANRMIQSLVPHRENAGGHDQFAGGRIDLDSHTDEQIEQLENRLTLAFAKKFEYKNAEWKTLIPPRG
ncbi:DHH family phosphoesterase [candidate division KSB1 bacterium]|nr:DHH family phosphoesterase [candidate division KSB1 bacterium]